MISTVAFIAKSSNQELLRISFANTEAIRFRVLFFQPGGWKLRQKQAKTKGEVCM